MKKNILILFLTIFILISCMAEEKDDSPSVIDEVDKVVTEEEQKTPVIDKTSIDSIVGLWVSISADNYGDFTIEGVNKSQFLRIEQGGHAHMEIEGITTDGVIKEADYGWEFHADFGTFFLFKVQSLDFFKNGCFELSIDDITYAYFKNVEELE